MPRMTDTGKIEMFHNRLTKVYRHTGKQAKKAGITCYRIYDHDLPEFPFCIEIYEDKIYIAEYERRHSLSEDAHAQWITDSLQVINEVTGIASENIFCRLRKRRSGRADQYQKLDETKHEFIVHENGLQFIVNLNDYLDTGLFLDHRITRQMVRAASAGKCVLNLFAYTGSFSVYAAAGGAAEVATVDLSNTYLRRAERNMQLNGFTDTSKYSFVQADVMQYLPALPEVYFDIIVMDPPTFSNSKRMNDFLDIQRDHAQMINHCMRALKPGGILYFSTNFTRFELDRDKITASLIKDITKATRPFDFEGKFFRHCFYMQK